MRRGARLRGRDIYYDYRQNAERQRADVGREVARWALRSRAMREDDRAVRRLAAMIAGAP